MTQQFLRQAQLLVGDASGNARDLSNLHFRFYVRHADVQTPHTAEIRVYNIADATRAQFAAQEFTQVVLSVGYGSVTTLFNGTIKQTRTGRAQAMGGYVDTFVDIYAAEGDAAYNNAVVNQTLAAGWTQGTLYSALTGTMASYGVAGGAPPSCVGTTPAPRGRVCFGMTRDHMRSMARSNDATWTIESNRVQMASNTSYLDDTAVVVLNSATGMIGQPTQTIDGLHVRCLLNPAIKPLRKVQINNKDILAAPPDLQFGYGGTNLGQLVKITDDGFYKVIFVDHAGDTRGQEWYSDLVCIGLDGSAPISQSVLGAGAGP